jgi:hypothetical protein
VGWQNYAMKLFQVGKPSCNTNIESPEIVPDNQNSMEAASEFIAYCSQYPLMSPEKQAM